MKELDFDIEKISDDFVVESRPLTKDEEAAISNFIRADKERRKQAQTKCPRKRAAGKAKELA